MQRDTPVIHLARSAGMVGVLERVLDLAAAAALFVMMLVTTVDVVGRYFFHSPLYGAYEGNELLLGVLVFLALPRVTWHGGHLVVGVIDHLCPPRWLRIKSFAIDWLSAVVLAVLGWRLFLHAAQKADYGDVSHSLGIPLAPIGYAMAALTVLAALAVLLRPIVPPRSPSDPELS